jgi:6-phosphofructokinase
MNSNKTIRRIAISTGGGDAPGLNAVIRAVVVSALNRGWECYGIREGFNGVLFPERYPDGGIMRMNRDRVRGITHLGGTILGTTNKGNPLNYPLRMPDGSIREVDRTDEIVSYFAKHEIDALVSIGGDGSLTIAHALAQKGLRVVGVPKTIDNDLDKTSTTFGFDTAVAFATESLDRLHSTAESHQRVMVVEVMGRYAGWIRPARGHQRRRARHSHPRDPVRDRADRQQDPGARVPGALLHHRRGGRGRTAQGRTPRDHRTGRGRPGRTPRRPR